MASLVTAPLERKFGQIPSLQMMTSSSSFGISQITLQFDLNRDIDAAAQDVQAAINAAGSTLPRNLPYPPVYSKVNPADAPIVTLALTSPTDLAAPAQRPHRHAAGAAAERSHRCRPRHRPGRHPPGHPHPGRPGAPGQLRHQPRRRAHRDRRRQRRRARRARSTARTRPTPSPPTIRSLPAAAYRNIVVAYRNGAPVLLKDIADIVDGLENNKVGGWYNGNPAIVVDIQRQPGANVIETVERIKTRASAAAARVPGRRDADRRARRHHHHPLVDPRRAVHADPERRARDHWWC